MKKTIFLSLLLSMAGMASCSANEGVGEGSVNISFPADYTPATVKVTHALLSNMLTARSQSEMNIQEATVTITDHKATLPLDTAGPARYSIELGDKLNADLYASPGETVNVDIRSVNPLDYTVSGTPLMDGMTRLGEATEPIEAEFTTLTASGTATDEQLKAVYEKYDAAVLSFLNENLNSPAAAFAMLNLGGQKFLDAYEKLGPEARASILMPFVDKKKERAVKEAEAEKFQQSLASGQVMAPDFTLPDLNGKQVSLSDFRGKWVVIDFWGSWCGWCIKGFPKLKEAYKAYDGKIEVIGVDCRDPEASWRAAVAKHELPWVNLYNAATEGGVLQEYMVSAFPTKAIVSPEGKLVDIVVGEDPGFYDKLSTLVNGK